jgi:hypothetical protein
MGTAVELVKSIGFCENNSILLSDRGHDAFVCCARDHGVRRTTYVVFERLDPWIVMIHRYYFLTLYVVD